MTEHKDIMWLDDKGEVQIDEDRMNAWFISAVQNLKELQTSKDDTAWLLFLMGAETVFRANNEDVKGES